MVEGVASVYFTYDPNRVIMYETNCVIMYETAQNKRKFILKKNTSNVYIYVSYRSLTNLLASY